MNNEIGPGVQCFIRSHHFDSNIGLFVTVTGKVERGQWLDIVERPNLKTYACCNHLWFIDVEIKVAIHALTGEVVHGNFIHDYNLCPLGGDGGENEEKNTKHNIQPELADA